MVVHAPFRFAPINRWVYWPEWGELVTHDVPFDDGLSGEIHLEIVAKTPLLVGGFRRKATAEAEGEVWPFKLGTYGPYAIPGSSLQGMVRSILEVAAFGKLGTWVDDRRYGIRDLSPQAKPFYRQRTVGTDKAGLNKVKAGFLTIKSDGGWMIAPCDLRRIGFGNIPPAEGKPNWESESEATARYGWVQSVGPFTASGTGEVTALRPDPTGDAWLVLTGYPKGSTKRREFVFIDQPAEPEITVPLTVIDDFRNLHEDYKNEDRSKWSSSWRHFWEKGYGSDPPTSSGGRFPIFYILDDDETGIAHIGLAQMFKLMHTRSPRQLLANSHDDHLDDTRLDLPTLIFGSVADERGDKGLKRRAAFDLARPKTADNGKPIEIRLASPIPSAILMSPKPTFYPIYVRQPGAQTQGQLPVIRTRTDAHGNLTNVYTPYATYTPLTKTEYDAPIRHGGNHRTPAHEKPELAGVKIWPAGAGVSRRARAPYLDCKDMRNVSTTLNPLAEDSAFVTTLRFHNLRPIEVGALLWALSFGEPAAGTEEPRFRHRLGMGKPLGLGELTIKITGFSAKTIKNEPGNDHAAHLQAFVREMRKRYADEANRTLFEEDADADWAKSAQILALLKAATPSADTTVVHRRTAFDHTWKVDMFDYMELNPATGGWNDFRVAKEGARFLPVYVPAAHELKKRGIIELVTVTPYQALTQVDPSYSPHKGARIRVTVNGDEGTISGDQLADGRWPLDLGAKGKTKLMSDHFIVIARA